MRAAPGSWHGVEVARSAEARDGRERASRRCAGFAGASPFRRSDAAPRSISAHFEAAAATVLTSPAPPLFFDYSGFPPEAYAVQWPAPGATALAARVAELLAAAGVATATGARRGGPRRRIAAKCGRPLLLFR